MSLFFINVLPANDRRSDPDPAASLQKFAAQSAGAGFDYTLMTIGNKRLDPWILAQEALRAVAGFSPLIAANPFHQHPVALAKRISTLQTFYPGRFAMNLVTGSFAAEMSGSGDSLNFHDRNLRLKEFIEITAALLAKDSVTFEGRFYSLKNAGIYPRPAGAAPKLFISGSFEDDFAGSAASPYFVKNARPLQDLAPAVNPYCGLGVGICARATDTEAQEAMRLLFPEDRQGELLFSLALSNNETPWNIWLKEHLKKHRDDDPSYNLKPIKNYLSSAPYLVGSYETVTRQLEKYVALGYSFFLFDFSPADFAHVKICMDRIRSKT